MTNPTIVVGVDFSDANRPALDAAIAAAQEMRTSLTMVHALTPLGAPGLEPAQPDTRSENNESADVLVTDQARAQRWEQRARDAGLQVVLLSRSGVPANVVLAEAQRLGADAIVVGTHGRTGLARIFMGSVADGVVKESTVPVLVVPQKPGAMQHVVFPNSPTLI